MTRFDLFAGGVTPWYDEVTEREGIRVTTPARTIVAAASDGTDPEQIEKAIRQAIDRALVTLEQLRAATARARYRHRRSVLPLVAGALDSAAPAPRNELPGYHGGERPGPGRLARRAPSWGNSGKGDDT